jgi:trimeric autotransporter adhesin
MKDQGSRGSQRAFAAVGAVALVAAIIGTDGRAALRSVPDRTWQTDGRVRAIDYSRGVVYIGGSFTHVRPPGGSSGDVVRNHVAAFDAATGKLLPWNPNTNGSVRALAASRAAVYIGGSFTTVRGKARAHVAAIDRAGGLLRWNPRANGAVNELVRDSAGNLYLGGTFKAVGGKERLRLARVGANGAVHSWRAHITKGDGSCPPHCPPVVFALGLSGDESALYIGGRFEFVNGVARRNAGAVRTSDGSTRTWNPNVVSPRPRRPSQTGRVLDMAIGSSRAYLCGDFWSVDGRVSANLAAVDLQSGDRDAAFDAVTNGGTPACELRDGLVYVGGHFERVGPPSGFEYDEPKATLTGPGTVKRSHIAAFDARTGAIAAWNPGANSVLGVHALASNRRHLGVGGDFTRIGGVAQQGFAQFSTRS